jgi:hypothetical protein
MMTNEMKLITALCDALGFEVEKVCVNKESLDRYTCQLNRLMAMSSESYMQHNMLGEVKAIYEYKLTKSVEKELTPDEKAVKDYILRNEAMLTKQVEEPFTKPQDKDEIFNTEMFGEVSVRGPSSDLASSEYNQTSLSIDNDYRKGLVCRIYDSVSIGDVIKALDKLYIARSKV